MIGIIALGAVAFFLDITGLEKCMYDLDLGTPQEHKESIHWYHITEMHDVANAQF